MYKLNLSKFKRQKMVKKW